ncbi:MAG TPA: hypothetical protein VGG64_01810 [Pirellulales bacterium]|jgi:ActR/RegA family two-component response regulator
MQPYRDAIIAPDKVRTTVAVRAIESVECLVVATDEGRRENLGFVAREGGWNVTLCREPAEAIAQARQRLLQMAIVDLSGSVASDSASYRFLVEQLACTSRMLLLVCGNVDDTREEVWARHLGVWMYLPGAIDGADLVGLCVAARETVERMSALNRQRALSVDRKTNQSR